MSDVAELCQSGLAAELRGDLDGAGESYRAAWEGSTSGYERCLAAHFLARAQATDADMLQWNQTSVQIAADSFEDDPRVLELLPDLYVNLAASHVRAGDLTRAQGLYVDAAAALDSVGGDGVHGSTLRVAIAGGLQASGFVPQGVSTELLDLLSNLSATNQWGVLSLLLPVYVGNLGRDEDVQQLVEVLRSVAQARMLTGADGQLLLAALDSAERQIAGVAPSDSQSSVSATETPTEATSLASPTLSDAKAVDGDDPFGGDSPNVALRI